MKKSNIKIVDASWHRNGIGGNGFYAILFDWKESGIKRRMVATLFDEPGSCAVLEVGALMDERGVKFGQNSWRGDTFEDDLRQMVKERETGKIGPFSMIPLDVLKAEGK